MEAFEVRTAVLGLCLFLTLRATRWPTSDTNGFGATRKWDIEITIFLKPLHSRAISQYANSEVNLAC
jgi:hypothetical protein